MFPQRDAILLSLALLFLALSKSLYAEKGNIMIKKNTFIKVEGSSNLVLGGDLITEENINGNGNVIMIGDKPSSIYAYNKSIHNLIIQNSASVLLKSQLRVKSSLSIPLGNLILDKHDLLLGLSCKINSLDFARIITIGKGKIIHQQLQPVITPNSSHQFIFNIFGNPDKKDPPKNITNNYTSFHEPSDFSLYEQDVPSPPPKY